MKMKNSSKNDNEMTYQEFIDTVAEKLKQFANGEEIDYPLLDCQLSMILVDIRAKYEDS